MTTWDDDMCYETAMNNLEELAFSLENVRFDIINDPSKRATAPDATSLPMLFSSYFPFTPKEFLTHSFPNLLLFDTFYEDTVQSWNTLCFDQLKHVTTHFEFV